MMDTGKILIGIGGLAIGLAAGYLIPRGGERIAEPGSNTSKTAVATKSARTEADRTEALKNRPAKKLLQSIPLASDYSGRDKWLENLPTGDLAGLIAGLCEEIGPDGLEYQDKSLLENALKKWWADDREGAIAWLMNLPAGAMKRYLMKDVLAKLLKDDIGRALAMSETFQTEDPKWVHAEFHDKHVGLLIAKAWETPAASAEGMLDLYSQLSRGNAYAGSDLGRYPENFDFRKFVDGVAAQHAIDKKHPTGMPTDVLEGWARVDPQAAAQWFLDSAEKGSEIPFQKWDNIAKAVATKNGPQAYHEWAADIISQATAGQRKVILQSVGDQDAMGIVSSLDDIGLGDHILATMARKNSGTAGATAQTIDFLAKISTPEARLQAIKEDGSQYRWWMKKYPLDASSWQKLGLTQDQVVAALAEKN